MTAIPQPLPKIAATVVVLALAFAGLLWTSLQGGTEYFKHVDEVMTNPAQWQGRPIQLHGFVVPGSIFKVPDSFRYRFALQNNGSTVTASYEGIVPDTFKDGAEVVLSGRLTTDGGAYDFHTRPDGVMAKCPSKYDAAKKVG
jgi:cytochrome c-type biogenesis protein CcmE